MSFLVPTLITPSLNTAFGSNVGFPSVQGGGIGYVPNAWLLNGTLQHLLSDGDTTTLFDALGVLFVSGFTVTDFAAAMDFIGHNDGRFIVTMGTDRKISVFAKNSSNNIIANLTTTNAVVADDGAAHSLMVALDPVNGVLHIYVDGVAFAQTGTAPSSGTTIDLKAAVYIGARIGPANFWNGCLWNVGRNESFIDISDPAIRNNIINGSAMKDPGSNGSNYFGSQPGIMLQSDRLSANINNGDGGPFTIVDPPFRCVRIGSDANSPQAFTSIVLRESNFAKQSYPGPGTAPWFYSLQDYSDEADAEGVKLCYFIDDADQQTAPWNTRMLAWQAGGHELGMMNVGADSLLSDNPIQVTYSGAETNPKLVISNSGNTWAFTTDEGGENLSFTNTGVLEANQYLLNGLGTAVNTSAFWTLERSEDYSNGFDDAFSESINDGTFNLTSGVLDKTMSFDQDRRKELEIDHGRAVWEAQLGGSISDVYYEPKWASASTAVEDWIQNSSTYSWIAVYGQLDPNFGDPVGLIAANAPRSGTDIWRIGAGLDPNGDVVGDYFKGDLTAYALLTLAEQEARIRLGAKGFACEAGKITAYCPIQLPHSTDSWTPDELRWLINELRVNHVRIVTITDAVTNYL